MATPIVVSNAALLTLHWSGETRTWANVIGLTGNPTLPAVDQALADALFAGISTQASFVGNLALMAPTVVFESISIRSINAANLPEFTSTGTPVSGGGTGEVLPLSVACCVTLRTALAGKRFRGRVYFSGYSEAMNDTNGRMLSTVGANASAAVAGIDAIAQAHSLKVAVVGRPRAAATIPAKTVTALTGVATPITAQQVRDLRWDSQRRRTGRS